MGANFSRGGTAPVHGLDMSTDEFVRRLQRHRQDPTSEADPRNLLTPNTGFDVHNGVRGPARPGYGMAGAAGARGHAPDKTWQLDAIVGHVGGRGVTLRELQETERRWSMEGGPRPAVLDLSHTSFSASRTVGPWSATPYVMYSVLE